MARDDFPQKTIDLLAKRVAMRCSRPECRQLTSGPRTESSKAVNVGVAAHITAASKGGPRFDPSITAENRQSEDNGIWLCQTCAKLIDNDVNRYPEQLLREWRRDAERRTIEELETRKCATNFPAELRLIFEEVKITPDRHDYRLSVTIKCVGPEPLGHYYIELQFPRVTLPPNHIQYLEVKDRGTVETILLRMDSEKHRPGETIYPGDEKRVLSLDYFMDQPLFEKRGELLRENVKVLMNLSGFGTVVTERPFQSLQRF